MSNDTPVTPVKLNHLDRREFLAAGGAGVLATAFPGAPAMASGISAHATESSSMFGGGQGYGWWKTEKFRLVYLTPVRQTHPRRDD